jgi:group I intron endonuclease
MEIICGIYKITSPSGKIYIGQSHDIHYRWKGYKNPQSLARKTTQQTKLMRSLLKYGWGNHIFEVIEKCDVNISQRELNILEIKYIEFFDCLNISKGLNIRHGGSRGHIAEETKEKLRFANIGKRYTTEVNSKKGRLLSYQRKAQLRTLHLSDKNPFTGKCHSKEKLQQIGQKVSKAFNKRKKLGLKTVKYIEVYKIDPITNNVLDTYNSVHQAAIANRIGKNHIHSVITKKKFYRSNGDEYLNETAGGFKWDALQLTKLISKIDIKTGGIIEIYKSIEDAACQNNLSASSVYNTVNKRIIKLKDGSLFIKTIAGGFKWERNGTNG